MSPNRKKKNRNAKRIDSLSLDVEKLEARELLAGVVVDNSLDVVNGDTTSIASLISTPGDDGISLREAVTAANNQAGADTITFDAALAGQTITLGGAELAVTDSLTIDASALASGVTIDAQQNSRVLNFTNPTGDLTLSSLTLQNGRTTGENGVADGTPDTDSTYSGAGIRFQSSGQLTLDSSTISSNSTIGNNAVGAGIFTSRGAVNLTDSQVSANSTAGRIGSGGGIFAEAGSVSLTNSSVTANRTTAFESRGAGIGTRSANVTLNNSMVSGNSTIGFADGGGIYSQVGNINIINSVISGNESTHNGGGIYGFNSRIELTNSQVIGNRAAFGGGIRANSGDVLLSNSTLSGNSAELTGGGIVASRSLIATNSTISGNYSGGSGGGITGGYGSNIDISSTTITGNEAAEAGGGISVVGFGSPTATIRNSIVAGNFDNGTAPDLQASTLTVSHSLIGNNTGSGLAEAQSADADGNFVGSANGNGVIDARLAPLANNGGPTQTHALQAGSLAINAADPSLMTGVDQRGVARVSGPRADMGAFEAPESGSELIDRSLYVFGTDNRDNVRIRLQGDQVRVQSRLNLGTQQRTNGIQTFNPAEVDRIVIRLHGERDVASVASNIAIDTHMDGGAGNDLLFGGAGANTIHGGEGNDLLRGGNANDVLIGGDGNDRLLGLRGSDILSGQSGNDLLIGGPGTTPDVLIGGEGRDRLLGGAGDDLLLGNLVGAEGDATALRVSLNDWIANTSIIPASLGDITADGIVDRLIGGPGDDLLNDDSTA